MRTVLIEIHSLNKKQINKETMPYLSSITKKYGLGEIEPIFGYDVQTAFWTGAYPEKNDLFAKYEYNKELDKSHFIDIFPHKINTALFNIIKYLKGHDFFTTLCKHKYSRHFTIARKYHFFHKNTFKVPTLFDILRTKNKKFLYYQWPTIATNRGFKLRFFPKLNDRKVGNKFIESLKKYSSYDFYFLQLRDLDLCSHKYGPHSIEAKKRLKIIDEILKKILENFSFEKDNILIFSYFGMLPVKNFVDLESKLPKFGNGYIYFLDSTMARFWFFDKEKKQKVMKILKNMKNGHILSDKEKNRFKLKGLNKKHGEEFFLLDSGYVINPSFFHEITPRGMHSYGPENEEGEEFGIFISNKKIKSKLKLVDFLPMLSGWVNKKPK